MKRTILVTSGLPYVNGAIHLGHLVETIQTDIWVRFQKMCGHECYYICGGDCHGTPIMLNAQKQGLTPEVFVSQLLEEQKKDFESFYIEFDNYYSTHSPENKTLCYEIYEKLKSVGDIETRSIEQLYDAQKQMFLPDRYVKGTCPRCGAMDQYGDACEKCGSTYQIIELIDPVSVVSGTKPILKKSDHYFFRLSRYGGKLKQWVKESHLESAIAHKLEEWFSQGLQDWDISRDSPYFGFEIPGAPNKYFYVWFDAPIGYLASFKNFCDKRKDLKLDFNHFWEKGSPIELYHFIGKDITYFHTLFWPAVLMSADFKTPSSVFIHGHLTVNGEKMSKSRGTFINASTYLHHLNPEYLRYYYASKLNQTAEDLDINLDELRTKVNSDLVGKVVNIASRCASFIEKYFNGTLGEKLDNQELWNFAIALKEKVMHLYEHREYSAAVKEIMALADKANQYVDEKKPWSMAKQPEKLADVQKVCTMGINLFRLLFIYLKPILPKLASESEEFLNLPPQIFADLDNPLLQKTIQPFKPLIQRIDPSAIQTIRDEAKT